MAGSDRHHGGPDTAGENVDGADRQDRLSDRQDPPDGIVLYALGTFGLAFLLVPQLIDGFIQAGVARWAVAVSGMGLLVGWGVALVGLVLGRRWGWAGSLCFHCLAFLLSLLAGNVTAILVLLLTGFYVLSKGSLYLDGEGSDAASDRGQ